MKIQDAITSNIKKALMSFFNVSIDAIEIQTTRKEFEGDLTVVVFPMLKIVKTNPVELGNKLGEYLVEQLDEITEFNVVKGFLNLVVSDTYYLQFFKILNFNYEIIPLY